jgi:hypothetical protein
LGSTWSQLVTPVIPSISAAMRIFMIDSPCSFLQVIGHIDNNALMAVHKINMGM